MNFFLNLPVRAKLFVVFGGLIALFAIAVGVAYSSINDLLETQATSRDKQLNVGELGRVVANHNEGRVSVLMLLGTNDRAEQQRLIDSVNAEHGVNAKLLSDLETRNVANPTFLVKLKEHLAIRQVYAAARENVFQLALAGNIAEARRVSLGENNERYVRMRDIINDMIADANADVGVALQNARETAAHSRTVFFLCAVAVVICTLLGVFFLGRIIVNPLRDLVTVANRVSGGDLKAFVPLTERRDEVGTLAQAFAAMLENFRTVHREIQGGVNVLATAASEIFTATAQMASSAHETAAAVGQTTSTAEEVKQTAHLSAQKAGNVADIAQRAAQSAQAGRQAVDASIAGMNHMRDQMELIAETIVRLSEQSQAIGEIITSVNELAEQSNLLAVNASIEAAKAGEHGKGFAVVAQEIRSLANRSKDSTKQIRGILNDIQRATTAAVMAAEQGSKSVDAGVSQVNQSGDTIRTLGDSILAAAQAATQITASAQQQLAGIEQVTGAIRNILEASKQNASGSQQAETGAKNLHELGQNLRLLVQRFAV